MSDSVNTVLEFYINGCAILATSVFGILGEYCGTSCIPHLQ